MTTPLPIEPAWRPDPATVIAMAIVAYGIANLIHEGAGHGGACLLAGCRPDSMSSIHFDGDYTGVADGAQRWIAAGGTIANVLLGLLAWLALSGARSPHNRWFLWMLAFVNLLQAAGYLLFSGIGNIGDWADVVHDWQPAWAWRVGLTVVGATSYMWVARSCAGAAAALVGAQEVDRERRARRMAWTVYFTGGILYCVSGVLNPLDPMLLLISAAAASFGGTSALLWCTSWLRNTAFAAKGGPMAMPGRGWAWIAAGAAMALVFVAVMGPGLRF